MTNKFKVGDMVRILNVVDSEFKEGAIGVIEDCDHSGYREWKITVNGDYEWFDADEFELVETTHKDSERITKLEEEVAELKLIVAQICKPSPFVSVASIIAMAEEPKTANQLRAEIIEKAKSFIEDVEFHGIVNFTVNDRSVIAVLQDTRVKPNRLTSAISNCPPNDVFNEHIGKAIALGRALGLDVSEFEQAVQPSLAVGQECVIKNWEGHNGKTLTITKVFDNGKKANHNYKYGYLEDCHLTIINDTNVQYEVTK